MNVIEERCRPKHQVLVLKCYPKMTKGAVDVVPNSSELSYLLFYATSRRSKIQKIAAFLEKKTAHDVWRMRIGNVQVTLGILAALVEKSPKDAALIAPCVLKILDLILRSDDITMVESSLPTFEAFCEHHDVSSLFGDGAYLQQYQSVVRSYAQLASSKRKSPKGPLSKPLQFRWRNAGLEAIKSIAASDALASVAGRQIDIIVPKILQNMWTRDYAFLDDVLRYVQTEAKSDPEKTAHRRSSINTVGTADAPGDTNPVALSGTAVDVDNLAEEETGRLAAQCLKSIFSAPNRAQIYGATNALLKFILRRMAEGETVVATNESAGPDSGWAIRILDAVARWTPVQDRYVILVAALDMMNRTPMREESIQQHLVFTAMIQSLLRSDINLIGLSVMDFLLGLVRQIQKLFQMRKEVSAEGSQSDDRAEGEQESLSRPLRSELLEGLENCTSDLANHVYYADQVSDMITAIFSRIRHSRFASTTSLSNLADRADNGADPTASPSVYEMSAGQPLQETYFAHAAGRLSALRIVKNILTIASPKTGLSGNMDLTRNKVPIQAWEGTQWLVRDVDGNVRKAYVDALTVWLDRETVHTDQIAADDAFVSRRPTKAGQDLSTSRRAVSLASARERQPKGRRCQYLPLLHLAIYDSALQFVDYDNDIVLFHSLLSKLVAKLGVNAAHYGIPMIYRLQEDIMEVEEPIHKVRVASLCHGYFWALVDKFGFEASVVGRAVYNEISRRKSKGFWVEGVCVPAPTPAEIGTPGTTRPQPDWDPSVLEREEILPFDDRSSMVECIAMTYQDTAKPSPPSSPAASPGRNHNGPILGISNGTGPSHDKAPELPALLKEHMLADWSRDTAMDAIAAAGTAESLNGSRAGTVGTTHNRGAAGANGNTNGSPPAAPHSVHHSLRLPRDRLTSVSKLRKSSIAGRISLADSATSNKGGVASVEQLKMILSGSVSPHAAGIPGMEDDSDESMMSYELSVSERSFNPTLSPTDASATGFDAAGRTVPTSASSLRGPLTSNPLAHDGGPPVQAHVEKEDEVPPVPPLPNLSSLSSKVGLYAMDSPGFKRNLSSRGGESFRSSSGRFRGDTSKSMDLQELLRGIDSRSGEGSLGNLTKPPY